MEIREIKILQTFLRRNFKPKHWESEKITKEEIDVFHDNLAIPILENIYKELNKYLFDNLCVKKFSFISQIRLKKDDYTLTFKVRTGISSDKVRIYSTIQVKLSNNSSTQSPIWYEKEFKFAEVTDSHVINHFIDTLSKVPKYVEEQKKGTYNPFTFFGQNKPLFSK